MPTIAQAGPDANYPAGTKEILLDGSQSSGDIGAVNWFVDSGPTKANLRDQNDLKCRVNEISDGTYMFRLRTKDKAGNPSEDKIQVVIGGTNPNPPTNPPTTPPPTALITKVVIHYDDGTTSELK